MAVNGKLIPIRWRIFAFMFLIGFVAYLQQKTLTIAAAPLPRREEGPQASAISDHTEVDAVRRMQIQQLERELKVSYPTVRARIDGLVRALGLADEAAIGEDSDLGRAVDSAELRRDVLERLARHEITADEAAVLLRSRKE